MDFRELLIKYIRHVGDQEGVYFIPMDEQTSRDEGSTYMPGPFSDEEIKELNRLIDTSPS